MYREALMKIKNIKLKCVDYFLSEILTDMVNEGGMSPIDIKRITQEALES
ncbi:hypothetical protein PbDSM24746_61700 [Paenibacillus macerans]|nr:hypothetical protein PbDSM24746_61700 [Paenibacillus macerans]GBK70449.1 hypothetical protein PbJCM17693_41570 [Paenibacillus macerans]